MANYTQALHGMISAELLTQLNNFVTAQTEAGVVHTMTAGGAIPLTAGVILLAIDGTDAYTLANGTYVGQQKQFRVVSAANTPDGTITPATPSGYSSVDVDAVGECCTLVWNGAAWYVSQINNATLNA